jgi:hypothetical protein
MKAALIVMSIIAVFGAGQYVGENGWSKTHSNLRTSYNALSR